MNQVTLTFKHINASFFIQCNVFVKGLWNVFKAGHLVPWKRRCRPIDTSRCRAACRSCAQWATKGWPQQVRELSFVELSRGRIP